MRGISKFHTEAPAGGRQNQHNPWMPHNTKAIFVFMKLYSTLRMNLENEMESVTADKVSELPVGNQP